jgi:hypothetical protein
VVRPCAKWKPAFWAEERGQIIAGVGPFLERRAIDPAGLHDDQVDALSLVGQLLDRIGADKIHVDLKL